MANQEKFQAVIEVNQRQALDSIRQLEAEQKKAMDEVSRLKRKDANATKEQIAAAQRHLQAVTKQLTIERKHAQGLSQALEQLSNKSYKDLQAEVRQLTRLMRDGTVAKNSEEWKALAERIKSAKQEMKEYQVATNETVPIWRKAIGALNTHWGAITQIIGAFTGLTFAVRKSVNDFAQMEEAMADVRKYTGMTDLQVRDLNESLKAMDTRTAREQLNELAGAAGRLGITSKEGILDFVEAGNMIKVALGDDLGEGAIDKVGKLAMAFGEDEKMGLRGAMEATGSAINELAQNSSAQAGYLVDFTARVAGFGKQLGLTQAQIMGFGAVMDENLLRDEMAATAFGNMLTKMQTDTAKFAKIAGMDMKSFADLLNKDANAAILALADNLKKADPQSMMKMLDDMGLDGSRAVGVLATLADKIDDVRARQELATKAYREGTSVADEYSKMNETVQAQIEKAKKRFVEMSVALGEQLLPIVKYTITGASAMIRILSVLVTGLTKYMGTIVSLSMTLAVLTVYRQKDVLWTKMQVLWNEKLIAGLKLLRSAMMKNPWTIAIVAVTALIGVIYDLTKKTEEATEEQKKLMKAEKEQKAVAESMKAVNEEANRSTAEHITKLKQLRRTLEDNNKKYGERKKALDEIKKIVPAYHGTLTTENKLINSNASALDEYVTNLKEAARAQAAFNRMVKLQDSSMTHEETLEKRKGNKRWAEQKLEGLGASSNSTFFNRGDGKYNLYDENGKFVKQVTKQQKKQIEHYQELVKWNEKRISEEQDILDINKKQSDELQKIVDKTKPEEKKNPGGSTYVSDSDRKKQETEANKAEEERLKRLREADKKEKGITDARLADNILSYQAGLQNYRQFTENQAKIQEEGLKARMAVWDKESAEYKKYEKELAALQFKGDNERTKLKMQDIERDHVLIMQQLAKNYLDENRDIFLNDDALRESRFMEEMRFLKEKKALTRKGSLEEMRIEWEIQDRDNEHKLENNQRYRERLTQYLEEMGKKDFDQLMQLEMKGIESMYTLLHAQGKMTEEEYDSIIQHIKEKYEGLKAEQTADNDIEVKGASALSTAKKAAGVKDTDAGDNAATGIYSIASAIENQQKINEELERLYQENAITHEQYEEAKRQAAAETLQKLVAGAQAAYSSISSFMSAASSYAQACSDLETAQVTKNYDAQIAAAGKNEKKKEKLEKEKEKALAKIKSEQNAKAMKIEIAQALASTAMAAINAYASAAQVPLVGYILAPIAAGMALAAGAIQIATIKKQHEAQAAGYYEGGFTGGKRYRKEAGVVHEGEFVANHEAVNNQQLAPLFSLLDQAQRNNRVGSLSAQDVTNVMGGPASAVVAPVVNIQNNDEELRDTLDRTAEVIDRMEERLSHDIHAYVTISGPDGVKKGLDDYEKLMKNK